jgi:hypothetical protein
LRGIKTAQVGIVKIYVAMEGLQEKKKKDEIQETIKIDH